MKHEAGFAFIMELVLLAIVLSMAGYVSLVALHKSASPVTKIPSTPTASTSPSRQVALTTKTTATPVIIPKTVPVIPPPASTPATQVFHTPQIDLKSGITGHTYLSIARGVHCGSACQANPPTPYQGSVQVKSSDGSQLITNFVSDASGYFSLNLEPGSYLLVPQPGDSGYQVNNQSVVVKASEYTSVTITYYGLAP